MNLQQQVTSDLKDAMKNRQALRLETIRSIKTAFTNELVANDRTPQDNLSDEEAMTVIKRLYKQRQDAAEQYTSGGRQDLADKETSESEILAGYLPKQLTDEELDVLVATTLSEKPELDVTKSGIAIGQVMKQTDGKADGNRVAAAVKRYFN